MLFVSLFIAKGSLVINIQGTVAHERCGFSD